ncbi:hypothetical protein [Desulfospira joergensenii]|nr:hypothetical protein [Desulfospira joergensenii]
MAADGKRGITFPNGDSFDTAGISFFGYFKAHFYLLKIKDGYELGGIKKM